MVLALHRPLWPREHRSIFRIVGGFLNIRDRAEQNPRGSEVREGRNPRSPGEKFKMEYNREDTTKGKVEYSVKSTT